MTSKSGFSSKAGGRGYFQQEKLRIVKKAY
jgi:hypothetical protein